MIQPWRSRARVSARALSVALFITIVCAWVGSWPASARPAPPDPVGSDEPASDDDAQPTNDAAAPDQSAALPVASRGVVAAIPGGSSARAILVGPSGELYLPGDKPDTWRRHATGGVAVDVRAAMSPKPGEYIVAGIYSPLYRSVDDIWNVAPLTQRGPVLLSATGGATVLAVGLQVHVFKADAFQRVTRARGRPVALWASSSDRLYLARQDGGIDKWQNNRWSAIRHPLPANDEILSLAGQPNRALYALAQSGAVLDVGANAATEIRRPAELEGFTPHAMAVAGDGALWLAGTAASPADTPRRLVLAGRTGKAENLSVAQSPAQPELSAGDRVTVLLTADNAILLATSAGRIMLRDPAGQWREGQLETAVPPAKATPATARPARTR